MRTRRGQALIELAVGILAVAIVVSALTGFALYIVRSLRAQNTARAGASEGNGKVETQIFLGNDTIETMTVDERLKRPVLPVGEQP